MLVSAVSLSAPAVYKVSAALPSLLSLVLVAGGRGNGLSLQSGLGELVVNDCFVRFAYRFAGKSGWFSSPTASGGFLPLLGDSSTGAPGLLVIETHDPLPSSDSMVFRHFVQHVRSAFTKHVGVPDVLLMVPLKISDVLPEGGRLHGWQFRPSATGTTGRNLQGLECTLFYFQGCLCKLWDVNY